MASLKFDIEVNLSKINDILEKLDKLQRKLEGMDKHSPNFKHLHKEFDKLKADLKSLQNETGKLQKVLNTISISQGVVSDSKKVRKSTDEAGASIQKYADSLDSLRAEMKKVSAEINSMSEAQRNSELGGNAKNKYGYLRGELRAASDEMRKYANEHKRLREIERAADGSLKQLRLQLSSLNAEYDGLSRTMRNGAAGKALVGQIQQVTQELNEAEQSTMRFYRNVGNYGSAWNGLSVQTQQLMRELPSLAVSANTFFLAISNNLPMLVDEIQRAKDELAALKKEGKQGVPVWKQLGRAVFSWQTALVVALTVLSTKGKDIANWIGDLFKGSGSNKTKTDIEALADAQKTVNEVMAQGSTEYGEQAGKLINLSTEWKKLGDNLEAKKSFIDENQGAFDELGVAINGVNDAEKLLRDNTEGFLQAISARAQATAAFKKVAEMAEEALKIEIELEDVKKEGPSFLDKLGASMSYANTGSGTQQVETAEDYRKRREQDLKKQLDEVNAQMKAFSDLGVKKMGEYKSGLGDLAKKDKKEVEKAVKDASKDYTSSIESLRRETEDREIELMKEGTEKQITEINVRYQREMEEVQALEKELRESQKGKLTDGQESLFSQAYQSIERARASEIQKVNDDEANARKKREEEENAANNEYLRKYGDYLEKRKALREYYAKEIEEAETEGEKKIKGKEYEEALNDLDSELMESAGLWEGLFSDFSNRSSSAIRGLIADIERLIQYMEGVEGVKMPDIFSDNKKTVDAINKAMSNPETVKKFTKALQGEITKFKKMLDEDNPFKLISDGFKEKDSDSIAKGFGKISSAVGALQNVMDDLGISADSTAGKMMSVVGKGADYAATGAAIGGPWGAAIGGALGIAGGIAGLFGADYSGYNRMKEQYETLVNVWDTLISKKQEYISIDYGVEASKAAEEATKLVEANIIRQRTLLEKLAHSGASVGSHSLAYRINKRMAAEDWARISKLIGEKIEGSGDLWRLPVDKIEKILGDEKLMSVLTTVNGDFVEYLQNIVKYGDQLDDIAEKEKEAITGLSFDEFRSSFTDLLLDLDSSNKDFANNFEKQLQKAILNSLIANQYADRIKALYEQWTNLGKDGLDETEVEKLRTEQQQIVDSLLSDREQLKEAFGWESEKFQQEASSKGFASMSQESADELSGRFTAMYEADLRREAIQSEQLLALQAIQMKDVSVDGIKGSLDDIKSQLSRIVDLTDSSLDIQANSYLELQVIRDYSEGMKKSVGIIEENLKNVARSVSNL